MSVFLLIVEDEIKITCVLIDSFLAKYSKELGVSPASLLAVLITYRDIKFHRSEGKTYFKLKEEMIPPAATHEVENILSTPILDIKKSIKSHRIYRTLEFVGIPDATDETMA